MTVTNTGGRAGKETVLWYITDEYARYSPALKKLKHFEKQALQPGESRTFSFVIDPEKHLSFFDDEGNTVLESGSFVLKVQDLEARFELY